MLRHFRTCYQKSNIIPVLISNRSFLTNDYKCTELWETVKSSPTTNKINLNDFYNQLDINYSSKGLISAIDVDIFAHAMMDSTHLEELRDLLHKLRLSAETGNMLESTHHATVRNFIKLGYLKELVEILIDPLTFGVFLDDFSANILLDELLKSDKYELAAKVASMVMLQEDFSNELTCSLCQYACYKYIKNFTPPEPAPAEDPKKKKVEEIKIRVKFLRNPYFDDHFDIKDSIALAGKSLVWISEQRNDNLNNNLQILGWMSYKKYDELLDFCSNKEISKTLKIYPEIISLMEKQKTVDNDNTEHLDTCIGILSKIKQLPAEEKLEESLKIKIENAINKVHSKDVKMQQELFKSWVSIREQKLEEQTKRLDRARRIQAIQEKQAQMKDQEQKLWFFENEEKIDLQIEEKEQLVDTSVTKKTSANNNDDNYIPPEIVPKRK